jgi:hypothetical protein
MREDHQDLMNTAGQSRAFGAGKDYDDIQPRPSPVRPKGPQAYKGNGKHDWQEACQGSPGEYRTTRLRVPGGFLYRYGDGAPVFVPMPEIVGYVV